MFGVLFLKKELLFRLEYKLVCRLLFFSDQLENDKIAFKKQRNFDLPTLMIDHSCKCSCNGGILTLRYFLHLVHDAVQLHRSPIFVVCKLLVEMALPHSVTVCFKRSNLRDEAHEVYQGA